MPDTSPVSDHAQDMEQRILRVMRKVLAKIVRDVSPRPGTPSPLSDETIEDIRECFNLISLRERELAESRHITPQKPLYAGQPPSAKPVRISRTVARKKKDADPAK